eukprot:330449-Rhodomonas_salina.1
MQEYLKPGRAARRRKRMGVMNSRRSARWTVGRTWTLANWECSHARPRLCRLLFISKTTHRLSQPSDHHYGRVRASRARIRSRICSRRIENASRERICSRTC